MCLPRLPHIQDGDGNRAMVYSTGNHQPKLTQSYVTYLGALEPADESLHKPNSPLSVLYLHASTFSHLVNASASRAALTIDRTAKSSMNYIWRLSIVVQEITLSASKVFDQIEKRQIHAILQFIIVYLYLAPMSRDQHAI